MNQTATFWTKLATFGRMVRLSHTIFGLPFALASAALAHRFATEGGAPGLTLWRFVLILVAFTGARTAAMGFNRIVDRKIDALNPRTAERELPAGALSVTAAWLLTAGAAAAFVTASWSLGFWPGVLSLPSLLVIGGYSLFKRFSWSSHLVLGVALSLAPGGAWIAVTGGFGGWQIPTLLMLTVATWVAGFDVLYALADEDFDRANGLHSIPARFGTRGALWFSGGLHLVTAVALITLHLFAGLGWVHALGLGVIIVLLAIEHAIVKPGDLSALGKAFFDINGYVSLAYLAAVVIETW